MQPCQSCRIARKSGRVTRGIFSDASEEAYHAPMETGEFFQIDLLRGLLKARHRAFSKKEAKHACSTPAPF